MREVGEGAERARKVLQQRVPEAVALARAVPDELLLGAGAHLHGGGGRAVACDLAVVVAVGADEVGEHARIAAVGLPAADLVALAVANPVQERRDPRTALGSAVPGRHDRARPAGGDGAAAPAQDGSGTRALLRRRVCGRDAGYPAPPAQIRTCALRMV